MKRFSQRLGISPVRVEIQKESMDEALRVTLWNVVDLLVLRHINDLEWPYGPASEPLTMMWVHLWKRPFDQLPADWNRARAVFRERFMQAHWAHVYDQVEFIAQHVHDNIKAEFIQACNNMLEREMSAYRFISDRIVEITNEHEIGAVEQALVATSDIAPVFEHLKTSLAKLSDRSAPDYRNSIKEAISAVEALCNLIVGSPSSLGHALKRLKNAGVELHPALESAWSKLYGYTSNEGGIRHALSDLPNVRFRDAKYMLVSCAAFITYLLDLTRELDMDLGK